MENQITKREQVFVELLKESEALLIGEFFLISGIKTGYFINFGKFNNGNFLARLADIYAEDIKDKIDNGIIEKFDILFGPAYKGIPLVASISVALWKNYQINVGFSYNRKEPKEHGEGGMFVGADMVGKKVLIIDDVMANGTTLNKIIPMLNTEVKDISVKGILVGIDREECQYPELEKKVLSISTAKRLGLKNNLT